MEILENNGEADVKTSYNELNKSIDEITIFYTTGMAIQDNVTAVKILKSKEERFRQIR